MARGSDPINSIVTQSYFNRLADIWDEKIAEKDPGKLANMANRLDIYSGSTVLDVGTGTGVFVPFLLQKIGPEGKLVCLDFAEEMLKKLISKKFKGNISYFCADIAHSQLADRSFDAVVCYSVFPHFGNKVMILSEINRLLKNDGGLFICHTSSRQSINEIHRSQPELCAHLFPENDEVRQMLIEAGFTDIRISEGKNDYLAAARRISN